MSFDHHHQDAGTPVPASLKSVCVYCGSSNSVDEKFKKTAYDAATKMAKLGLTLVYGGGRVGLMGIVADAGMEHETKVIGIIPEHIRAHEIQHTGLTELHVVPDMHTRKRMMVDRSDAFVILPGGLGTLDECFEILTWKKLGLHKKPIIIFNQDGYWDPLLALIDATIDAHFSTPADHNLFKTVSNVDELLQVLHDEARVLGSALTGQM